MDPDDVDMTVEAAMNEEPVEFNSLEEMSVDLRDETSSDSLKSVLRPQPLKGAPAEALRQMRDEERY